MSRVAMTSMNRFTALPEAIPLIQDTFWRLQQHPRPEQQPLLTTATGAQYAYGEIERLTRRLATVLHWFGIEPAGADRVVLQVEASGEALLLCLACLRCGAVYVPVRPEWPLAALERVVIDTDAQLLIGPPALEAELDLLAEQQNVPQVLTLGAAGDGTLSELAELAELSGQVLRPAALAGDRRTGALAALLYHAPAGDSLWRSALSCTPIYRHA
jgi:acyl-coenzyme A synthetase/AMP-(fatty) acid ligase